MDTLSRRTLSAVVLAPVVIGAAWLGGWGFTALVAIAALLMAYEWDRLCGGEGFGLLALVSGAIAVLALALVGQSLFSYALAAVAAGAGVIAVLARVVGRGPAWPALGVVYVGLPCVLIVWLREDLEAGRETLLWLLALVWATDLGAYFVGRGIGGPRLAPRVSPGKTWAGLAGGVASAAVAGAVVAMMLGRTAVASLAFLSAGLGLVSQFGDLVESWIKRHFGVKDSGRLIPGHGGILDRVDGLLFAAAALGGLSLLRDSSPLMWR